MKLFKVYFLLGKAHSPEHLHVSSFNAERNCTDTGELKWLIVLAENELNALELATKGYESACIFKFKFSQDFLKTQLRDSVA